MIMSIIMCRTVKFCSWLEYRVFVLFYLIEKLKQ